MSDNINEAENTVHVSSDDLDVGMISKREPHPAHAGFAEAVGADRIDVDPVGPPGSALEDLLTGISVRNAPIHDVYILEDAGDLYAAPFLARRSDPTFVLLAASHRTTLEGYRLRPTEGPKAAVRWLDRHVDVACLRRLLRRYVDGVVANSDLSARSVRRISSDLPVRIAEPYVQPVVYGRLQSVDPALDGPTAVFVGEAREHKGIDLLVEAWPEVRRRVPNARLELVGRGHAERHGRVEGVTVRGYVDRIEGVFGAAALYVHPARYEAWGVAPAEAMLAGLPSVVTDRTGIAPHVAEVHERLVTSPNPTELAETVTWYFRRDGETKRRLSERARARASPFDESTRTDAFEREFRELLSELG
jgi:glycosyltransferase involved in cell wall biosynthesis